MFAERSLILAMKRFVSATSMVRFRVTALDNMNMPELSRYFDHTPSSRHFFRFVILLGERFYNPLLLVYIIHNNHVARMQLGRLPTLQACHDTLATTL